MTDYISTEIETDNLVDAQIEAARIARHSGQGMSYEVTENGIKFDWPEIPLSEAIAVCERIAAKFDELDISPPLSDERREAIRAAIFGQATENTKQAVNE
jgi:hypothetical protein